MSLMYCTDKLVCPCMLTGERVQREQIVEVVVQNIVITNVCVTVQCSLNSRYYISFTSLVLPIQLHSANLLCKHYKSTLQSTPVASHKERKGEWLLPG